MNITRREFDTPKFKQGAEIRSAVLGEEFVRQVDASGVDDLSAPLRKLITEWCWGEIWARPGLDRKTRSFVNLGLLIGADRSNELKLHLRGALNNGITLVEIREVIMQSAIYCGVPAALEAMRSLREVANDMKIRFEK